MIQEAISSLSRQLELYIHGQCCSTTGALLVLSLITIGVYWLASRQKYKLPPGPTGLPIVGYFPFLGEEPYKVLDKLSKKYGNVFGLHLGQTYVVILGNYEAVKEAFSKSSTTDRPPELFDFIPDYVGFSSLNGEDWTEQRRFVLRVMRDIGLGRTRWEQLVQEEVDEFVEHMYTYKGNPIDVTEPLSSSVANNITSLVFGQRLPLDDPVRRKIDESILAVNRMASQASMRNFLPRLHSLLVKLGVGQYGKDHQAVVAFNDYIKKEIEEHKKSLTGEENGIFIDDYLNELQNKTKDNLHASFNESNLRGNTQALLFAGSDTTRTALTWLFLAMANFPQVQYQVFAEIRNVLGPGGRPSWLERSRLPYTNAVILECQRWMPIVPLNTTRIPTHDIKLGGYDIPKGTSIIANYWALHKDPRYFRKPDDFKPERFLSTDGKSVIYKQDSYVPFSYGKRNCPGETVAMIEIFLYFTSVLQRFKVLSPAGETPNLQGILGITYHAVKQELKFVPRK